MYTEDMKRAITKYIPFIDLISKKYKYPDNIKHLLYVIVPAFVIKYGIKKEHFILECLDQVPIIITGKEDPKIQALYVSYPYFENGIKTKKAIYLNRYNNIPFLNLIDNLIHELNHAINSYQNEVVFEENTFYLRTGLTKAIYDKKTLNLLKKENTYVLEEIINCKQTEVIIDIIKQLKDLNIDDIRIQNTIEAVSGSIDDNYISPAYFVMKHYCQELLNNKTFLLTLENLRIEGNIDDIENWFNSIAGDDSYNLLVNLLYKMMQLQITKGLFNQIRINNIASKLVDIGNRFNQNSNLK